MSTLTDIKRLAVVSRLRDDGISNRILSLVKRSHAYNSGLALSYHVAVVASEDSSISDIEDLMFAVPVDEYEYSTFCRLCKVLALFDNEAHTVATRYVERDLLTVIDTLPNTLTTEQQEFLAAQATGTAIDLKQATEVVTVWGVITDLGWKCPSNGTDYETALKLVL